MPDGQTQFRNKSVDFTENQVIIAEATPTAFPTPHDAKVRIRILTFERLPDLMSREVSGSTNLS
jgi:hypothetical protein